jgi:alpha,alpha-trehalase
MYRPLEAYGLIGNRRSCALVARDGSIDWCCLPGLDSPSVFASVLDARRGGHWRVAPVDGEPAGREYFGDSAVLRTRFRTPSGELELVDLMPIRPGRGEEPSYSAPAIARIARCTAGRVSVEVDWMPRPDYARADVTLDRSGDAFGAHTDRQSLWLFGLPEADAARIDGARLRHSIELEAGEDVALICAWSDGRPVQPPPAATLLDQTLRWWRGWAEGCEIAAHAMRWREPVMRSGMVIKLLTSERTGAIAAAPTTSLPEEIGGVRNWDYRFCWVRDASMTARAFATLGQPQDGLDFLRFIERAAAQHNDPARIQVMYGLRGETRLTEFELGHLDGYRGSRPVRIGNGAALQRQLDAYGELLDAAWALTRGGSSLPARQWEWLRGVADHVCRVWRSRDRGIWEVRGPERHFTYSKLMCWVALDRAIRLAGALGTRAPTARWRTERDAIRTAILERGYSPRRRAFVQHFESETLDASNLLIPHTGFLPASDPRVASTVEATLEHLTEDGLVHRYDTDDTTDGVGGGEGAFGICTFWLVDALAMGGRTERADEIFSGMLARANDLGLYAEEIDPTDGTFLGNFPQAFTHIGLIDSAHHLGRALTGGASNVATPALDGEPLVGLD